MPWRGLVGNFLSYWYYYLPDYALAVLMYTVLGRAALSLFLDANSQNYIWRFFCNVTDPVVAAVGAGDAQGDRAHRPVALQLRLAVLAAPRAARRLRRFRPPSRDVSRAQESP